ncbi:MAG: hypothetical protein PHR25_01375 [Clostridia bacterium]|nr:hypothetical protein [Clostridia bacterium]MDD4375418.1 hypothetical protein [Clostridia bacterium]
MSNKILTYTYRIYPNKIQKNIINNTIKECNKYYSLVFTELVKNEKAEQEYYKKLLLQKKSIPKSNKKINLNNFTKIDCVKNLGKTDLQAVKNEIFKLQTRYKKYYMGKGKFPQNSRSKKEIYETKVIKIYCNKLKLPVVGNIKAKIHREIKEGDKIKRVFVKKDSKNKYYVGLIMLTK